MRMQFYTNDVFTDEDDLYVKNIDLTNGTGTLMSFDVAYAYYSENYWDELKVEVSIDCGINWDVLYDKAKDDLATVPATDVPFIPKASQWRTETIDLTTYDGYSNVMVRFAAVSGHGNNLYVDNINIGGNVGIEEINSTGLSLFPNPASSSVSVTLPKEIPVNSVIKILNDIGQVVYEQGISFSVEVDIPVAELNNGAYLLSVTSNGETIAVGKLIVAH